MPKMMMSVLAGAALIGSACVAFADDTTSGGQMQNAVVVQQSHVVCHHDGEIIQSATGPVMCHMRPMGGIHFKSREWFGGVSAKAAGSNNG